MVAFGALICAAGGASAQQAYDPMRPTQGLIAPGATSPTTALDPDLGNLPVSDGVEDTYYQCSSCHSTAIIKQQHLTDARWDYLWGWMVKEQGMYEPEDETRDVILSYLKRHFSSER